MSGEDPTLYEWAGGDPALQRLTEAFYRRVRPDPLVGPLFRHMDEKHPQHVATWLGEVFGGPPRYTEEHGGYPHMLKRHRGLAISEEQRRRWVELICDAADEAELPSDPARPGELPARGRPAPESAGAALGLGRGAALSAVGQARPGAPFTSPLW